MGKLCSVQLEVPDLPLGLSLSYVQSIAPRATTDQRLRVKVNFPQARYVLTQAALPQSYMQMGEVRDGPQTVSATHLSTSNHQSAFPTL